MPRFHPVDIHVGARLRQRRTIVGLSQTKLSESVGLTFQQIQKYERGTNRISSSRLYEFAKVLAVPVSYFFDEMPSKALSGRPLPAHGRKGFGEAGSPFKQEKDPPSKRKARAESRSDTFVRECSCSPSFSIDPARDRVRASRTHFCCGWVSIPLPAAAAGVSVISVPP